jgi:hypothetical protein
VAPLEAVAEVVPARDPEPERGISVRVELLTPQAASAHSAPKSLPSESQVTLESEIAQLTAANTAAALARGRSRDAYAKSRDLLADVALARGVCIRVDA